MNKKKITISIVVVILLIIAVFVGITIRKVSILNNLITKGIETGKTTNYHIKNEQELGGETEAWVKDNEHYLVKMKINAMGGINRIMYRNGNEQLFADEVGGHKVIAKNSPLRIELNTFALYMDPSHAWINAITTSIHSTQVENKDCYEISLGNDTTVWVEKETSLVVKAQTAEDTTKYTYEIGNVTDTDIQKPDLTGYIEAN